MENCPYFEREQDHNKPFRFMLPAWLVDNDGLRKMYLRSTKSIKRRGERHDAAKDALPHNLISVSSA